MKLWRRVWKWDAADGGGDDTTSHELILLLQLKLQPPLWLHSQMKPTIWITKQARSLYNKQLILTCIIKTIHTKVVMIAGSNTRSLTLRVPLVSTKWKSFHSSHNISSNHDDHRWAQQQCYEDKVPVIIIQSWKSKRQILFLLQATSWGFIQNEYILFLSNKYSSSIHVEDEHLITKNCSSCFSY